MDGRVRNIAKVLLVFVVSLELMARVGALIDPKKRLSIDSIQRRDATGIKGVPYGRWKDVILNKFGFNDTDDYEYSRKPGVTRILFLGDSIGFYGSDSDPLYNWPNILEDKLQMKGRKGEVINTATIGNDYSRLIKRFEAEYIKFDPDLVLIYKDFRSYMQDPLLRKKARTKDDEPGFLFNEMKEGLGKSAFLKKSMEFMGKENQEPYKRLIQQRRKFGIVKLVEDVSAESLKRYEKDLRQLVKICKDRRIMLVLASFPCYSSEKTQHWDDVYRALYFAPEISVEAYLKSTPLFNKITHQVALEENLPYLELYDKFTGRAEYFKDNYHLTDKGKEAVAQAYADELLKIIK